MSGSGSGIPISGLGTGKTRGELKKLTRFLLGKLSPAELPDKSLLGWSLEDAIFRGYERVARETKCLRTYYTLSTVAGQADYQLEDFGEDSGGARIFEITNVSYADVPLDLKSPEWMDRHDRRWRVRAASTPHIWIPWSEGTIRLHPKPAGVGTIYIEGFATPDPGSFDADSESAMVHSDDSVLIAVYAAMLCAVGNPSEHALRTSSLFDTWEKGITDAKARTTYAGTIIVGRWQDSSADPFPPSDENITPL